MSPFDIPRFISADLSNNGDHNKNDVTGFPLGNRQPRMTSQSQSPTTPTKLELFEYKAEPRDKLCLEDDTIVTRINGL